MYVHVDGRQKYEEVQKMMYTYYFSLSTSVCAIVFSFSTTKTDQKPSLPRKLSTPEKVHGIFLNGSEKKS